MQFFLRNDTTFLIPYTYSIFIKLFQNVVLIYFIRFLPVYLSENWYFIVLWNCMSPYLSQIASINPFCFYIKEQLSRFMMRSHLRKANIRTSYYVFINFCKNINGDWQFFLVFLLLTFATESGKTSRILPLLYLVMR